jgi:hypothetical protein
MDSTELSEYLTEVDAGTPYYEMLICDFDTDRPTWWACNLDGREIDPRTGCPDHRPTDMPGLARSECELVPPHAPTWTADGDHQGYGSPCHQCMYDRIADDLAELRRCRHWGWHRWAVTRRIVGWMYVLGIISGSCWSTGGGIYDCHGCTTFRFDLRKRPYILGAALETWRCWFHGHRRGEEVGFGFCGKCVPWTCCGSQAAGHVPGCAEDDRTAVAA